MRELCSEFSHGVALLHMLPGEEVQAVKVLRIALDYNAALRLLYGDDRLHKHAHAVLDVLSH